MFYLSEMKLIISIVALYARSETPKNQSECHWCFFNTSKKAHVYDPDSARDLEFVSPSIHQEICICLFYQVHDTGTFLIGLLF